jgi:DNA-binding Lrp family transcriptional regulator
MLLKFPGLKPAVAVDELKKRFREVVWVAGAWGDASVIALLESANFENIASLPFKLREQLDYEFDSRTYIIPSALYHVKETPIVEDERLAVILINLAKDSNRSDTRVLERLGDIEEVRRYGAILGPWDTFAEVRYQEEDELYSIAMEQIHDIRAVLDTTTILTMRNLRREGRAFTP